MLSRNVRVMIIGATVGAALGATAAWAINNVQESKLPPGSRSGRELALQASARDYVGIVVTLVALLRQVVDLFKPA